MFFSVIIPMYNSQLYIEKTMDSILAQSMKDFEVVVVDDGSKDKSGEIVHNYAEKDKRIRLISQENGGQSKARNRGLEESRGEYIIHLDSDDFFIDNDFFKKLKESIESTSADVVMYRYVKYYEDSDEYAKSHYDFKRTEGITTPETLLPILAKKDAYYGSAWTKSVKKSLLLENGIRFDEKLSCEDVDWSYRIMEKAKSIFCLDEVFVAYRQRKGGSVSTSGSYKNAEDFLKMVEKYKERYEQNEIGLSESLRAGLLSTVAKLYSNLMLTYLRVSSKDKKKMKPRLKALASVLKYGTSKRPVTLGKFQRVFGFSFTLFVLGFLDKVK